MDGWCKKYQENVLSRRNPKITMGRTKGAPYPKWKNDVEIDIRKMGIVNWIEVA